MKSKLLVVVIAVVIAIVAIGCAYQYINQLNVGMTENEVFSIMGKGSLKAIDIADDGSEVKVYLYAFFDEMYFVAFKSGRLVKVQYAGKTSKY